MRIFFSSLGCDKNLVDSEEMIGILVREGYEITDDEYTASAEVVVDEADTVTIDTSMAAWKTVPVDNYSDTLTFTAEIV